MKGLRLTVSLMCVVLLGLLPELGHASAIIVAGTGAGSFSGDNAAASLATLSGPNCVAFDNAGNLYIADTENNRIRRVDAGSGIITTVAGNGSTTLVSGPQLLATATGLKRPQGLAVDGVGNIYLADSENSCVRRIDHVTGYITTVAGTGIKANSADNIVATTADLNYPEGLALDLSGNLYIAEFSSARVRKVSATNGVITPDAIITTVAGTVSGFSGDGGLATSARLDHPTSVAVDSAGNIYITDTFNNAVRKVLASNKNISTLVGGLSQPQGLTLDSTGNLYIADSGHNMIKKVAGSSLTIVADATVAALNNPKGVALDGAGNLIIADTSNNVIKKWDTTKPVVTASILSGSYYPGQVVTLTANEPATIYYTTTFATDHTFPTTSSPSFDTTGQIILGTSDMDLVYVAIDRAGNGDVSTDWVDQFYTMLTPTVPDAPTAVHATASSTQAVVTFSAPFNGGTPIRGYTVTSSSNGTDLNDGSTSTTHTMTGLTNGTSYTFTVVAHNDLGDSPVSALSNSVTPGLLQPTIGAPSAALVKSGASVSYAVSYVGATSVTLAVSDVTLNKTGSANGTVAVTGSGTSTRTVTISGMTGVGTLGISLAAGTASASAGTLTAMAAPASATFEVDCTAPVLAVTALPNNTITSNNTLTITGTTSDTGSVPTLTVNGSPVTVTNGAFSTAVTLITGPNTITVTASDAAGNQTSDTRSIIYDHTAPLISFAAPTPADSSSTNQQSVAFAGTVSKPGSVSLTLNSGDPVVIATSGVTNSFSFPVTLIAGANSISIVASDTDTPPNTSTVNRTVTYDATTPVLAVIDPDQDITTNLASYLMKGTVSDNFAGATLVMAVDGVAVSPAPSVAGDGSFQQVITFTAAKTYHVTVTANDLAGNSTTVQRNIIYNPSFAGPSLDLGSTSGARSATVTVPVTLNVSNNTSVAGVSMDVAYATTNLGNPTATLSAALAAAGYTLATTTPSSGIFHIGISNVSAATIGSGVVANLTFTVNSGATAGNTTLNNTPAAVDPNGIAVAVTGANGVVNVITKAGDCNGDGKVTITEVQSAINMFLKTKTVAACVDLSGDGKVTITEVQKVINSFLGL